MSTWFEQLKSIVNRHEPAADENALARAGAVVLLEMAAADDHFEDEELDTVHRAIERAFGLAGSELDALMAEARSLREQAVSLHDFTRSLRTGLARDQRDALVGWLWKVALADGHIDRFEEQLLRRLADLLGVPHEEFIRRKHMAAEEG
ncbi:MAG: TerB family tellurite resistance protein [Wenzhouxiangella sp.]|nr:TerB family tellurite resistance protein [Wenzhouxiangella sp.]